MSSEESEIIEPEMIAGNPETRADSSDSALSDLLCVGVYCYYGVHDAGDVRDCVLAVSDKDAMQYLDNKYTNIKIFAGGTCSEKTNQFTEKARQVLNT